MLVEDEISLAESVRYNLEREGLEVIWAESGSDALRLFRTRRPHLILLDLMLPETSGLDVCKAIRAQSTVPIIMLTAKDSESDKVVGLEMGADDYITKPFSMRELVSRVRAQLRRASMEPDNKSESVLEGGDVVLDTASHEATSNGRSLNLTPKEFALLQILMERKGKLLTRDFLIDEVWGPERVGDSKTLDVHIRRLREKIEKDPKTPLHIVTVRGLGYKFVA